MVMGTSSDGLVATDDVESAGGLNNHSGVIKLFVACRNFEHH
jgi:hypothetical protein